MEPWNRGTLSGPLPRLLARLATALGLVAVYGYAARGLTLSHYDARAHLVVSRRIIDSLTPGWEQIGAVWLPLPHLLNLMPVQIDHLYRTGGFAIGISVLSYALTVASLAATVLRLTGSAAGAVLAATAFATNANVLYLQATPMTEPLLFGLIALQVYLLTTWAIEQRSDVPRAAGWVTVLACLTRYEAWPIAGCAFALAALARWRQGLAGAVVASIVARLALYPIGTVAAFMLLSRLTVGEWFVTGGFFVPDETLLGQPWVAIDRIVESTTTVGGWWLTRVAAVGLAAAAVVAMVDRARAPIVIPLALMGAAALPFYAYVSGHPVRIRYAIPLVVAAAVGAGLGVGLLRRAAPMVATVIVVLMLHEQPVFDPEAAMVREAQLDRANSLGRERVTYCLDGAYDRSTIMTSMGSLAHYMHELSTSGFRIRDFLHEGNGVLWDSAYTRGPAALAGWVLVEEHAEGGDAVFQRHRTLPRLLEEYDRVCEGGNVALYRRR